MARPFLLSRVKSLLPPSRRFMSTSTTAHYTPPKPGRDLSGRVAIITGAGSRDAELGNGRATALLLAEDGAHIACVDTVLSRAEHTLSMLPDGSRGFALSADVTREEDCRRVVDATLAEFGRVDILVNMVGILGGKGTAPTLDAAEWEVGMRVNVTSMMLMARFAIPAMLRNDATEKGGHIKGSIVNVASVAGLRGGNPNLLYPTSKGAVVNLTRAMAAHHGQEGVRVNCVCPGMMYTPMVYGDGKQKMSEEVRDKRRKRSLLGTEGNAWDCASAVRFLAGDEARWITGAVLVVDAGATAAVGV